jgi:hypothetical protein
VLDLFYTRLRRCGDVSCVGKPFTEHRHVPVLVIDPASPRANYPDDRGLSDISGLQSSPWTGACG